MLFAETGRQASDLHASLTNQVGSRVSPDSHRGLYRTRMLFMPVKEWNATNELLNSFQFAIEQRTSGRLSGLSIEAVDEGVVIEARSSTYHAVQLALAAIDMLSSEFPDVTPTTLAVRVNGHMLVLHMESADHAVSRHGVRKRSPVARFSNCATDETTPTVLYHRRRQSLTLSSSVDSHRSTSVDTSGSCRTETHLPR